MSNKYLIPLINGLIATDNYAPEAWEKRGLTPSSQKVVALLNEVTLKAFNDLKEVGLDQGLKKNEKLIAIVSLVDSMPWQDLDTEEREFLAEVLAPAIDVIGFDLWSIM